MYSVQHFYDHYVAKQNIPFISFCDPPLNKNKNKNNLTKEKKKKEKKKKEGKRKKERKKKRRKMGKLVLHMVWKEERNCFI